MSLYRMYEESIKKYEELQQHKKWKTMTFVSPWKEGEETINEFEYIVECKINTQEHRS